VQITVLQAILLGIASYAYNSGILGGWIFLNICSRPLTIAFAIGLIMGDMKTAMIIGCVIQALYLGATSIGGVQSMPAIGMSMFFGIPIAIAPLPGGDAAAGGGRRPGPDHLPGLLGHRDSPKVLWQYCKAGGPAPCG